MRGPFRLNLAIRTKFRDGKEEFVNIIPCKTEVTSQKTVYSRYISQISQILYWFLFRFLCEIQIYWLIDWLIYWLIDWFLHWLIERLIDWLTDFSIDWLIDWLIDWTILFELVTGRLEFHVGGCVHRHQRPFRVDSRPLLPEAPLWPAQPAHRAHPHRPAESRGHPAPNSLLRQAGIFFPSFTGHQQRRGGIFHSGILRATTTTRNRSAGVSAVERGHFLRIKERHFHPGRRDLPCGCDCGGPATVVGWYFHAVLLRRSCHEDVWVRGQCPWHAVG